MWLRLGLDRTAGGNAIRLPKDAHALTGSASKKQSTIMVGNFRRFVSYAILTEFASIFGFRAPWNRRP